MSSLNYKIVSNVLSFDEINTIKELTYNKNPNINYYGRKTFLRQPFKRSNLIKYKNNKLNNVILKLSNIFIENTIKDIPNDTDLQFEVTLDRLTVTKKQDSNLDWHRDISFDKKVADYIMIILLTENTSDWSGGELMVQKGGRKGQNYEVGDYDFKWDPSPNPCSIIPYKYNHAIIFQNNNSLHKVIPICPKNNKCINRDLLIITFNLPENESCN